MRSKLPHRRDVNQPAIVEAFERLGCSVHDTSALGDDFPDLVVGLVGVNLLVEVKSDSGELSQGQQGFRGRWRGQYAVVRTEDDVIALVQRVRKWRDEFRTT